MTDINTNRRASDSRILSIEDMIAAENDQKQRSFLIVMNNMSTSLLANTDMIKAISDKFESHVLKYELHSEAEEKRLNQGRGMTKAAAWFLGVAQVVVMGLGAQLTHTIMDINTTIIEMKVSEARLEANVVALHKLTDVQVVQEKK